MRAQPKQLPTSYYNKFGVRRQAEDDAATIELVQGFAKNFFAFIFAGNVQAAVVGFSVGAEIRKIVSKVHCCRCRVFDAILVVGTELWDRHHIPSVDLLVDTQRPEQYVCSDSVRQ